MLTRQQAQAGSPTVYHFVLEPDCIAPGSLEAAWFENVDDGEPAERREVSSGKSWFSIVSIAASCTGRERGVP